jgi:hypothetical protein
LEFYHRDFVVASLVDDFEAYTDDMEAGQVMFQSWLDGVGYGDDPNDPSWYDGNGTGSTVGNLEPPYRELLITHGGMQSMPLDYDNTAEPWYSETQRIWATPQDWTADEADTLTWYFRGEADNDPGPLYMAIEDNVGHLTVVTHPDAEAVLATEWQKWHIALADLQAAGLDLSLVKRMSIGVGDRDNPKEGGTGRIYIDDISVTNRLP